MNMMTVLLGATGLLLVVAIVLSFGAMNKSTDEAEVARLKAEIALLEEAQTKLTLSDSQSALGMSPGLTVPPATNSPAPFTPNNYNPQPSPAVPTPPATVDASDPNAVNSGSDDVPDLGEEDVIAKLEKELADLEEENSELSAEKQDVERENGILKTEQEIISQPRVEADRQNRARGATIRAALLQARITEWAPEGFGVAEIHRPDLQRGTVLAIRRNSGIYGQVKVDKIYTEENKAIVNPILNTFPVETEEIDIKPGDDLIIPPL